MKEKIENTEEIESKEIKKEKSKKIKAKKHFDPARGAVKIIALLLVIMMLLAACGSFLFYLIYTVF